MGSLYTRSGSKNIWIRYRRAGRLYQESSGSPSRAKAKRLLQLREGAIAKGEPVTPKLNTVTYEAALADVLADYRNNGKRSAPDVARRAELHLTPVFGGRKLAHVRTTDLRTYIAARLDAGARPGSINRELALLRRMFSLARQAGTLTVTPYFPMLREADPRPGFFEREQFEAVCRHLPAPLDAVATFLYWTGWRKSEALTLQWKQVDLEAGTIRLDPGTTKNRDGRVFYFAAVDELAEVLERQRRERDTLRTDGRLCPFVFHRHGKPIRDLYTAWRAACLKAGCPGRLLHDLRRTAVRNLVRAGVPERVAMQITGHKTRAVFERYNIVSDGDLRQASERLNASHKPTAASVN